MHRGFLRGSSVSSLSTLVEQLVGHIFIEAFPFRAGFPPVTKICEPLAVLNSYDHYYFLHCEVKVTLVGHHKFTRYKAQEVSLGFNKANFFAEQAV